MEIFREFSSKLTLSKVLAKIEIVRKFWLQYRFFQKLYQNRDFRKFGPKSRCLEWNQDFFVDLDQTLNFHQFWPISLFFENFVQNWDFRKVSPKSRYSDNLNHNIKTFKDFDQNCYFSKFFYQNRNFSKVWHQLRFFKNLTKMEMFRKNWQKSRFSKTVIKIEIFRKFHQNWHFQRF